MACCTHELKKRFHPKCIRCFLPFKYVLYVPTLFHATWISWTCPQTCAWWSCLDPLIASPLHMQLILGQIWAECGLKLDQLLKARFRPLVGTDSNWNPYPSLSELPLDEAGGQWLAWQPQGRDSISFINGKVPMSDGLWCWPWGAADWRRLENMNLYITTTTYNNLPRSTMLFQNPSWPFNTALLHTYQ